jgi:hypothetical protein
VREYDLGKFEAKEINMDKVTDLDALKDMVIFCHWHDEPVNIVGIHYDIFNEPIYTDANGYLYRWQELKVKHRA